MITRCSQSTVEVWHMDCSLPTKGLWQTILLQHKEAYHMIRCDLTHGKQPELLDCGIIFSRTTQFPLAIMEYKASYMPGILRCWHPFIPWTHSNWFHFVCLDEKGTHRNQLESIDTNNKAITASRHLSTYDYNTATECNNNRRNASTLVVSSKINVLHILIFCL